MTALMLAINSAPAVSADVFLPPDQFLAESFDGKPPKPSVIWVSGDVRERVQQILGHSPGSLRVRYWLQGERTAWILEEIGKTEPITTGIVVDKGAITRVEVLIYRESRGWEVKYPSFTKQFTGATLTALSELDRQIDGITGATLSVRALTRLVRMALYLDARVREKAAS